jgi:hypothetical protein
MRVLCRVALALLMTVPVLFVLVIVFALAGRRRAALPLESGISRSLERGAAVSPATSRAPGRSRGTSLGLRNAIPGGHYPGSAGASRF